MHILVIRSFGWLKIVHAFSLTRPRLYHRGLGNICVVPIRKSKRVCMLEIYVGIRE